MSRTSLISKVLPDNEVEALFRIMNDLRDKGVAMVYISHKMDEICSDRPDDITIMRDGTYLLQHCSRHCNRQNWTTGADGYCKRWKNTCMT